MTIFLCTPVEKLSTTTKASPWTHIAAVDFGHLIIVTEPVNMDHSTSMLYYLWGSSEYSLHRSMRWCHINLPAAYAANTVSNTVTWELMETAVRLSEGEYYLIVHIMTCTWYIFCYCWYWYCFEFVAQWSGPLVSWGMWDPYIVINKNIFLVASISYIFPIIGPFPL